jgi:hypothetical protein
MIAQNAPRPKNFTARVGLLVAASAGEGIFLSDALNMQFL